MARPQLSDYDYLLPEEKIALHPLEERDAAKMLVYKAGKGITHSHFRDMPQFVPENTLLVLNDTRVVHARLLFRRNTGALVEVFCLHPLEPYREMTQAMMVKGQTTWQCLGGNQRRWKEDETLTMLLPDGGKLHATLLAKLGKEITVSFSWSPADMTWASVLDIAGQMPLPPYIHRPAGPVDETEYQTVFARNNGAVAAPTASLHFTDQLLARLQTRGVETAHLTLHVGAGTFQPVAHEDVLAHPMHCEQVIYDRELIEKLASGAFYVLAAGTTGMRALESLYWFGSQLETAPGTDHFFVAKLQPYQNESEISLEQSMKNILDWMQTRHLDVLHGETEIFIFPSYRFRVCNGLITNFHLPKSTLLMLIAAFIGDSWKDIYASALENNYRFLSYGDGMLLEKGKGI